MLSVVPVASFSSSGWPSSFSLLPHVLKVPSSALGKAGSFSSSRAQITSYPLKEASSPTFLMGSYYSPP